MISFFAMIVVLSVIIATPILVASTAMDVMTPSTPHSGTVDSEAPSRPLSVQPQARLTLQDTFIIIPSSYEQELTSIVEFRGIRVYVANKSKPFDEPLDLGFEDPLRIPSLFNESRMRIDAVIQNYLSNSSMAILEFGVNILQEFPNGTVTSVQSMVKSYRDKEPYDIVVPAAGSYTGSIEFDVVLPEFGTYIIQVTAQVVLPEYTLAEIHELSLPFNMTFSLIENPPPNPDILIYSVWLFALLLTGYLGLGVYGYWVKRRRES